jgi:hypothetical protein
MTEASAFLWLALGAGWCLAHLLVYVLILRDRPAFYGEPQIFRYHLGSACTYSILALIPVLVFHASSRAVAVAGGLIALHGIYSISFLELWSLAQGSYSISVLHGVHQRPGVEQALIVERFAALGESKKADRLTALLGFGLIFREGENCRLTAKGRRLALVFRLLRWLPNLKNTG